MAKKWKVMPFTAKELHTAKQRLFQVVDPDDPDEVVTLRVSSADGEKAYDKMIDSGEIGFEWEFEDPTEVVARRKLAGRKPPPANKRGGASR